MSTLYFECCKIFADLTKNQKKPKMTELKRQFDQDRYEPIVITIIKHAGELVILRQGDNKIYISNKNMPAFVAEMDEVKRWSTSP